MSDATTTGQGAASVLAALEDCAKQAEQGNLTLADALTKLGGAGYCFATVVLVVPFIQPISLGPLASVGGLAFAAMGLQLMSGRDAPLLPKAIGNAALDAKQWATVLGVCRKILGFVGKFSKLRLSNLAGGRGGQWLAGLLFVVAGLLMAIPFFGIPFNNTLPAIVILCAAFALLERDGLMFVFSFFWLAVTIAYFGFIFYVIIFFGNEAMNWLREMFPWFG